MLLEKGVLKVAVRCLKESEWPHVHFKSLGIARLLADQQGEECLAMLLDLVSSVVCRGGMSAVSGVPAWDSGTGV